MGWRKKETKKSGRSTKDIFAAVLICAFTAALLAGCGSSGNSGGSETTVIGEGESLSIPIADITGKASFYPVEVDGTEMEVFAVKASDGTIRTAFNTCQSCFTSGQGYYNQDGTDLVCNNCGFHFNADQVEVSSGGCNPWPIFEEDKVVTGDTIEISYDFLSESKGIFANWKTAVK